MPHFSDDPGSGEDPDLLLRLQLMLRGRHAAPRRLPTREERFGVPTPRDGARDPQDAVLAAPEPRPAGSRPR
ncbi:MULTISPECIES: hypothetical protein [Methylobacterium]|uniref:Uncharacterized protein n=1 Tax=Methylobacterium longum TaxID=767694 RepID=A0ABT8ASJ8_9HYPH|nr:MULTISPECIES: hypothetical protein [Methylobacterium]MCJ2100752.1 hypothetical protein [Methylobacterium sp. E-046]MDN3572919.1 hypothetical protein [Methylobacterium longum]GJE09954.1 hypothetical protein FOHLNKBM_0982 [Methylobacterium longum]